MNINIWSQSVWTQNDFSLFIRREVLPGAWRPSLCRASPVTSLVTSCCSPEVTARCSEVSMATWSILTSPVTRMAQCRGLCLSLRPPPSWGRGQVRIWPPVTASAGTRTLADPWPRTPSAPPTAPASTSPTSPTTAASGPYSAEMWREGDRILLFLKCDKFSNTDRYYWLNSFDLFKIHKKFFHSWSFYCRLVSRLCSQDEHKIWSIWCEYTIHTNVTIRNTPTMNESARSLSFSS